MNLVSILRKIAMKPIKPYAVIMLAMSVVTSCSTGSQAIKLETEFQPLTQTQIQQKSQTVRTLNTTVAKDNKGKMTAEQVSQCQSLGGKVTKAGMAQFDFCLINFADAGKVCHDGSECQSGSCQAPRRGIAGGQVNQSGTCSQNNAKFGCHQTVTKGVANSRLCID